MYRTYEAARDRLVAVKLFRLDLAPEQAELFARELIRLVEIGLAHPAIVQPLAGGIEGCAPYLALEYVAAESLETALRHDAPAKAETVATLVRGLGGALDEAASRGVFHGALHPRDVYVAPDRVRATGFGLVQALERVGVPPPVRRPYTAPERIEGRAWGPPADVFSLAALAFELLTGRRLPGPGPAAGDLSGAHPEVSGNDGLRQVLAAALAEASEARYPTGEAFADAFDAAVTAARFVPPKPAAVVVSMAAERARSRGEPSAPLAPPGRKAAASSPAAMGAATRTGPEEPSRPAGLFDDLAAEEVREPAAAPPGELSLEFDENEVRISRDEAEAPGPVWVDEAWSRAPLRAADLEDPAVDVGARDPGAAVLGGPSEASEAPELARSERAAGGEAGPLPDVAVPERGPSAERRTGTPPPSPPPGPRLLPYALVLMAGLLAGFVLGYGLGSRERESGPPAAALSAAAPALESPARPAPEPRGLQPGPAPEAAPMPPPEGPATQRPGAVRAPATPRAAERAGATRAPAVPAGKAVEGTEIPAARAAGAPMGRVVVRSAPPGAGVVVNGAWRGRTPLAVDELPWGSHLVRVVQPGFRPVNRRVTLTAEAPEATVTVELVRDGRSAAPSSPPAPSPASSGARWGSIFVDSQPRGARVWLDDRPVGVTPVLVPEVPPGSHRVRVERHGLRPWAATVEVAAGRRSRLTATLAAGR